MAGSRPVVLPDMNNDVVGRRLIAVMRNRKVVTRLCAVSANCEFDGTFSVNLRFLSEHPPLLTNLISVAFKKVRLKLQLRIE
jgi:hypothetical protein